MNDTNKHEKLILISDDGTNEDKYSLDYESEPKLRSAMNAPYTKQERIQLRQIFAEQRVQESQK